MRVGDSYRIRAMARDGTPDSAIYARFGNTYPEEEIAKFIAVERAPEKKSNPKPTTRKRVKLPKVDVHDISGDDL